MKANMCRLARVVGVAVLCVSMVSTVSAEEITIETVPVGNAGNGPDDTGYGSVSYDYNIGKYEVTAGQYTEFLNAVADTDAYGLYNPLMSSSPYACKIERAGDPGSHTYSVASAWANRPVNFVSWGDAARFANWLTNGQPTGDQDGDTTEDGSYYLNGATSSEALQAVTRTANARYVIPTEDEWYKAAYYSGAGSVYYDYPTGTDSPPSNDLSDPDPGNNANFIQDGYTIDSPYWRTPVGDFENSESPYGTFDQGGNVWEWNEAILYGSYRAERGGSFFNEGGYMHAAAITIGVPTAQDQNIGFRVAEVPEPATMLLVGTGVLGLAGAVRRRRRTA